MKRRSHGQRRAPLLPQSSCFATPRRVASAPCLPQPAAGSPRPAADRASTHPRTIPFEEMSAAPADRRFVQITDAIREANPWTNNEWLCRPDIVAADKLLLVRANMAP